MVGDFMANVSKQTNGLKKTVLDDDRQADGDPLRDRVRSLRLPTESSSGNAVVSLLKWLVALGLIAAVGFGVYVYQPQVFKSLFAAKGEPEKSAKSATKPVASSPVAAPLPAVQAADSGNIVLESKGYIIPTRQILVSPKISGMIVELNIIEGQRVKEGEALAKLEDTDYLADRDRAKEMLESARRSLEELRRGFRPEEIEQSKAELAETQFQLDRYQADYQRNAELLRRKMVSQEVYDSAYSQYMATKRHADRLMFALKLMEAGPRIERKQVAEAQVRQAEAELRKAEWRLSNCTIVAPISGTILKKNAEKGNIVNPIAFNGSFSLCELANLADLEVELLIQERDISKVFKGQECKIRAEAYPEREYKGYVSRLMPIADRAKGAIPVRVKISIPADEEGVYLKPEMGAVVSFMKKG
jgi:HlyD family secretion protein